MLTHHHLTQPAVASQIRLSIFGRPFVKQFALCYQTVNVCPACPVCPVCLSVVLVYCGQTVGWIKMKLGMQVGLGPWSHCVRWRPSSPSTIGEAEPPQFSAHIFCGQMAGWIKIPLGMVVGLGPGDSVLDGNPASPFSKRGGAPLPNFRPMSIVAKRLDGSRRHLEWRWALVQATLC